MPITEQIKYTNEKFGGKKDLLLLDNNVLASKQYNHIIDEIKEACRKIFLCPVKDRAGETGTYLFDWQRTE